VDDMLAVDHEERRRRIAEVAVDLIAREGLEATTIRRIAAEIRCSTTIVTHYFSDKHQLLLWAFQALAQQGWERVDAAIARDPADLVGALVAMAAADQKVMRSWRVYVAFWERAARDPALAELQRRYVAKALERIGELIRAAYGERGDAAAAGRLLNALVQGISVQALADPDYWTAEQIRSALAREVELLLGPRGGAMGE
jgi:AcrR family transcriptional regulator